MRKLAQATFVMGISTILVMGINLLRTKVLAVLLGPAGVGLIGLLNDFLNLVTMVGVFGFDNAVAKYVSEFRGRADHAGVQQILSVAWSSAAALSILVSTICIALSAWIAGLATGDPNTRIYVAITALAVPFIALSGIARGVLRGLKAVESLARQNVLVALVSGASVVIFTFLAGTAGAVVAITVAASVGCLLLVRAAYRQIHSANYSFSPHFERETSGLLVRFGGTYVSTGGMFYLSTFWVRSMIVKQLGLDANGLFQAAMALGALILVARAGLPAYFFPRVSEIESIKEIGEEVNNALRLVALLIPLPMVGIILFSEWIVPILYSSAFLASREFLPVVLLSEFWHLVGIVTGVTLSARGKLRAYFWVNTLLNLMLPGLTFVLLPRFELAGVAASYAVSWAAFFLINAIYLRWTLGVLLSTSNVLLLIGGIISVIFSGVVILAPLIVRIFVFVGLFFYTWVVLRPSEREGLWSLALQVRPSLNRAILWLRSST